MKQWIWPVILIVAFLLALLIAVILVIYLSPSSNSQTSIKSKVNRPSQRRLAHSKKYKPDIPSKPEKSDMKYKPNKPGKPRPISGTYVSTWSNPDLLTSIKPIGNPVIKLPEGSRLGIDPTHESFKYKWLSDNHQLVTSRGKYLVIDQGGQVIKAGNFPITPQVISSHPYGMSYILYLSRTGLYRVDLNKPDRYQVIDPDVKYALLADTSQPRSITWFGMTNQGQMVRGVYPNSTQDQTISLGYYRKASRITAFEGDNQGRGVICIRDQADLINTLTGEVVRSILLPSPCNSIEFQRNYLYWKLLPENKPDD